MNFLRLLKHRWMWLVGIYFILLMISTGIRWEVRAGKPFPADKKWIELSAVENDKLLEKFPVRLAYREFLPTTETGNTPIILIHGSPGDGRALIDLARELSHERRVIVPDLPGFGDSGTNIPDFSFRAHAFYLKQLADKLDIGKFHALGFSMGGGVVLNLYDIAPERVSSIEMISAIGVQEYELLGDYYLNHFLHSAQLAGLWALQNLVPHFGFLDHSFLGISYARNFYDSDQRPLRSILNKIEPPFLIVHGTRDPLVPLKAAREHFRLVPQSEIHELDDNHFMVFERPESIAPVIEDFLKRVESSEAVTRKNAALGRIRAASAPFEREMVTADGSTALVFFLVIALATLVSEDLTLLSAGALAGQGQISLTLAIAACFFGIFIGDLLLYLGGRFFGSTVLTSSCAPLNWFISDSDLNRGAKWLEVNGMKAVFLSRVTPGLRLPMYVAAGVLKANFLSFAFFFALAAAVWTPVLVTASAWFSKAAIGEPVFSRGFWVGIFALVALIFILLNLALKLATWRGRRLLIGSWKRRTEWEFWSLPIFYLPVIIYICRLSIRFHSLSVFADANPAIEAGGFVGERKDEIYEGLCQSGSAAPHLLCFELISGKVESVKKFRIADDFMQANALSFPIALKPNVGERGTGVFIVKTADELKSRLENSNTDLIIQEFAAGDEFSVFYYRYPDEKSGRIFAITQKQFPAVTGDGKANLETLILRDKRAVALTKVYFERNRDRLDDIPAKGEKVSIIDIGTHSKGAIFFDGGWVKTELLESKFDEICRGYAGFYFGRFDLRTNSTERFRRGENFKIIELNGVTSEATSIYDPKNSLFDAYRVLFEQWRIAFEIGAQNRRHGATPTSIGKLIKLIYGNWFGKFQKRSEIQKLKVQN